jgi:ABC-type nitrate/sulfonate/bicarbonate transport system permease component
MSNTQKNIFTSVAIWLGIIIVWETLVSSKLLSSVFFASPTQIISEFRSYEFLKLLVADSLASLSNIVISVLLGYLLVHFVLFAGVMVPFVHKILLRLNTIIKFLPIPALIPFGILFFGLGVSSKIFIITFSVFIVYFSHVLSILDKEEFAYKALQRSWKISHLQRFWDFVVPIANRLNYRILTNLIIWVVSSSIIVEMILGGDFGFGVRLLQFQQLYQVSKLFAYIAVIVGFGLVTERLLTWFFARLFVDIKKIIAICVLTASILVSGWYFWSQLDRDENPTLITYSAGINLPLMVMTEKYNSLGLELQTVGSGIQAMDALQAKRTFAGGYVDFPNALSGISQNNDLKIVSQVVETKTEPTLFLISKQSITPENFAALNNTSLGYFPNNPLIASGFEFTALGKKSNPRSIKVTSSNDPANLVQSYVAGTVESIIAPEPYITQIEKKTGDKRINPDFSLIQGIQFNSLPLAAFVIDEQQLNDNQIDTLRNDLEQSVVYIRNHTKEGKADDELSSIMEKYEIDRDISLSKYQLNSEIDFKDTEQMINLIKLIDSKSNLKQGEKPTQKQFYLD